MAAEKLLPLVYAELRRLAAQQLAGEQAGQTLDATGLVHEAYLRLAGGKTPQQWDGRGHFFAAAAEAMRRILVKRARRRDSQKRGRGRTRVDLDASCAVTDDSSQVDMLALDEALNRLAVHAPAKAELVKLRTLPVSPSAKRRKRWRFLSPPPSDTGSMPAAGCTPNWMAPAKTGAGARGMISVFGAAALQNGRPIDAQAIARLHVAGWLAARAGSVTWGGGSRIGKKSKKFPLGVSTFRARSRM